MTEKLNPKETAFVAELRKLLRHAPHSLNFEIGENCFNGKQGVTIYKKITRGEAQEVAFIQNSRLCEY